MKKLAWIATAALTLSLSGCILFLAGDSILYEDAFDGTTNAAWHLTSSASFHRWIDSGKLYMMVKDAVYAFSFNQTEGPFGDVQIDLDADHILGTSNVAGGGLIFRVTDFNNLYAFLVSPAGTFTVIKWVAGVRTTLLAWAESTAIRRDVARNHVTVIADGQALTFLVNGTEVAMLTDSSFALGRVGVAAVAFNPDVDVLEGFDNLAVREAP